MPAPEFTISETVQRYAATLADMTPRERDERLDLLRAFSEYADDDPDDMIRTVFDEETRKYKKRGHYTALAKEFAASYGDSPNAQLQRSNVVRAFFIANGRRLLTERPAWMSDDD